MFYVLVKFKDNPVPTIWGVGHLSYAARLATMADVEWASPIISNGTAVEWDADRATYGNPHVNGGAARQSVLGETRISAYTPVPAKASEPPF